MTVSAALPAGAKPSAAVLNVTATNAAAAGYLTAYACDTDRPLASNLNPAPGQDVAAHVVAPVGADGKVCIFTHDPTDVVVDIMGWYGGKAPDAAGFEHVGPSRLLDTRSREGPVVARAPARVLHVLGTGRIPNTGVTAVVVNVTATNATGGGFATVYACDDPLPTSSNLNFDRGLDVANLATVPVRATGAICLYTNRTTDLIVDVEGWFGTA